MSSLNLSYTRTAWILDNTTKPTPCYHIFKFIPFYQIYWLSKSFRALQTCLLRERACLEQNKRLDLIPDKTGQWSTQWECYSTCKHSTGSQSNLQLIYVYTNKLYVLLSYRKSVLYVIYLISQWPVTHSMMQFNHPLYTMSASSSCSTCILHNWKGSNYILEKTFLWITIHFNSVKYHMHY